MGVTYHFKINFIKQVDINSIIQFFLDRKFEYIEELGFGYSGDFVQMSLKKALKLLATERGGGISLKTEELDISISFCNQNFLCISIEHFMLQKSSMRELMKDFVRFIKNNYPIKNIEEKLEHEKVNYFS